MHSIISITSMHRSTIMAMTSSDKDRMLNHFRSWYKSHAQSVEHFTESGNDKAVEYHKKQMDNLEWMAKIVKSLDTEEGIDCPF